jgi:hypothetical protein
VNGSIRATSWRVIPYCAFIPNSSNLVSLGTVVRIVHQEVDGCVASEVFFIFTPFSRFVFAFFFVVLFFVLHA